MAAPPHHPPSHSSREKITVNMEVQFHSDHSSPDISSGESALSHILFQPYYIGQEKSNKKSENA